MIGISDYVLAGPGTAPDDHSPSGDGEMSRGYRCH